MNDPIGTTEAAAILGVSSRTAKRLAMFKRIPAVKVGGTYIFERADVLAFHDGLDTEAPAS